MEFEHSDVLALVGDIWSAMTGIEMVPATAGVPSGESLTGFVHIGGAWQGTVTLQCPTPLARAAAASMFGMEDDELGDDEVHDALGELTNMTGGGIKALLPGPSQLSIPTVVGGGEYQVSVPGTAEVAELHFTDGRATIAVRVLQRLVAASSTAPTVAVDAQI